MTLRSARNYDRKAASQAAALDTGEDTPVVQSAKDDADINVIVKRFRVTGQLPVSARLPQYGDYTGVSDYRSAMQAVRRASEAFMALPGEVRARFGNDPQAWLEFASDSDNLPELQKMGLANKSNTKEKENVSGDKSGQAAGNASKEADGKSEGDAIGARSGAVDGGRGASKQ